MNIKNIYRLYKENYLVDTDTRNIRENSLFFALKGDNFNGNKFAEKALALGAKYAIIDEAEYQTSKQIILVDNVLTTLQNLAIFHRNTLTAPIIGLTGSNGKTTTKELINCVLQTTYKTTATKGNLNNHIGVPLTILSITPDTEIGIIEMGANHQKEIAFLSTICKPDFGYITNFGKAHLEGFGGVDGVIKGKSELYDYIKNNDKSVFVNPEDPIQLEKTRDCKSIVLDSSISLIETNPLVSVKYKTIKIQSNLIGNYNYTNIAAAITIGNYFKVSESAIKKAIESYYPTNNRSQIIQKKNIKIILDAYNANPTSMKAALDSFNLQTDKHKTVILGDMFELGKSSSFEHQSIADLANELAFTTILFVGENFYTVTTNHLKFKSFEDLAMYLKNKPLKHQSILIKGSRGMRLERLLEILS